MRQYGNGRRGLMRGIAVALLTALLLGGAAPPALAYLDPGTGSYVFQMVAAALAGAGFLVRAYWHRLRGFFIRRRSRPEKPLDGR